MRSSENYGLSRNSQPKKSTFISQSMFNVIAQEMDKIDEASFKLNLREIEEELGIKVKRNSPVYEEVKHYLTEVLDYPNTSLAQLHRQANVLGKFDTINTEEELEHLDVTNKPMISELQHCPCCGFKKQEEELKICTEDFLNISSIGISTYLFFRTNKNLIFLLTIALTVFCLFAFITNLIASDNLDGVFGDTLTSDSDVLAISLGSKLYLSDRHNDYIKAQVWLGFVMIVLFIVAYVVMEYYEENDTMNVEDECKSASDYSVVMFGIPTSITKPQLQQQFQQWWEASRTDAKSLGRDIKDYEIVKINLAKPIDVQSKVEAEAKKRLEEIEKNHQEYEQQVVSWIMELKDNDDFVTPKETRDMVEKKYYANIALKEGIYLEIVKQVTEEYEKDHESIVTTGFVTLASKHAKDALLETVSNNAFDNFIRYLTFFLYTKQVKMHFGGEEYKVKIEQASEPEDVIWSNIGISDYVLCVRKVITFLATFVLLGISFAVVYGLSQVQVNNSDNRYISVLISLFISVFNFLIIFTLRIFTYYEYNFTQTRLQTSLAAKAIVAQLINTIAIPIIVNRFIKDENFIYQKTGLADDIFLLGITTAFVGPFLRVFDLYYVVVKYLLPWYVNRPHKKFFLNQIELNRYYELMEFESGYEYIYMINAYLFTCFFISLQPIIVIFTIAGLILNYWAQKYSLFHRCKRPIPGTKILYDTTVQFVYAGGLFYAIGSLTFINFIPEDIFDKRLNGALVGNIVTASIAFVSLLIPISWLYDKVFGRTKEDGKVQLYSHYRILLPSEYDRLNPATSAKAIDEYFKFVEEKKKEIKTDAVTHQNLLKLLDKQGHNNYHRNHNNPNNLFGALFAGGKSNTAYNQLVNPQIQVINPGLVHDYIAQPFAELFEETADNQHGDSNTNKQFIPRENQMSKNPNPLAALMNGKSNNLNTESAERLDAYRDDTDVSNPLDILAGFGVPRHGDKARNNPIRNPMNYGASPYNPAIFEDFKKSENKIARKSTRKMMK